MIYINPFTVAQYFSLKTDFESLNNSKYSELNSTQASDAPIIQFFRLKWGNGKAYNSKS